MSKLKYEIIKTYGDKFEVIGRGHCGNGNDALYKTCDSFDEAVYFLYTEKNYVYE